MEECLRPSIVSICDAYLVAKQLVIEKGFEPELLWQLRCASFRPTESDFLREAAWVVLSSGMNEKVVRSVFPTFSAAFFGWRSAAEILCNERKCRRSALQIFRNPQKINAILKISFDVVNETFESVWKQTLLYGPTYLQGFPFIGPITSLHLAKNLGLPVAKPDRHLQRIAKLLNYSGVHDLCSDIAGYVGDEIS
jgi:hypothetical protein